MLIRTLCSKQISKIQPAERFSKAKQNIWVEFIGLLGTVENPVNLGQGFPDASPDYIRNALGRTATEGNNLQHQYARSFGLPRLVRALARFYGPLLAREIDPLTEILVTVGGYQSLSCCGQGLINPGDEAIIIEPFFDCYEPVVRMAGGVPVFVPLRQTKTSGPLSSADFVLDPEELRSKFNPKTKAIFFNNPNNPLGKVYRREEVELVASLCREHDVVCISDEVYEHQTFEGTKHIRIASLPGMWERTVTIGSAGKTFSVTGWKIGWSVGPSALLQGLKLAHQDFIYTCATPLQEAVAGAFELEMSRLDTPDCYFSSLPLELVHKRDRLAGLLRDAGFQPVVPEGTYYMAADFRGIKSDAGEREGESKDHTFSRWLLVNKRLSTIPISAFYSTEHKHLAEHLIRFCFCKSDSTLDRAAELLQTLETV